MEGVTKTENQRTILKSLLMPYFIIKQSKSGAEKQIVYRNSEKVNIQKAVQ